MDKLSIERRHTRSLPLRQIVSSWQTSSWRDAISASKLDSCRIRYNVEPVIVPIQRPNFQSSFPTYTITVLIQLEVITQRVLIELVYQDNHDSRD